MEIKLNSLCSIMINCKIDAIVPVPVYATRADNHVYKERLFKLDTGATNTCINAVHLGICVSEAEFAKWNRNDSIITTGIMNNTEVKYYKLQVENFIIGDLDLGSVPIYVTFNKNATKSLLGMDLIRLLNIGLFTDERKLILQKANRFIEHRKENERTFRPELLSFEGKNKPDLFNAISLANPNNK